MALWSMAVLSLGLAPPLSAQTTAPSQMPPPAGVTPAPGAIPAPPVTAAPVPVVDEAALAATAACRKQAVVAGKSGPLIFYNAFLEEVGRVQNPVGLKIRIDDCDPYFFYLNAEDVQKAGTFSEHYRHTRVAVKNEDVVLASLSSFDVPKTAPVAPKKKGAGSKTVARKPPAKN